MEQKKGQAAMEFLMTYGWAILAAIIAIGALAYFGVFNPSNLAGATAAISSPLNIPSGGFAIQNLACDSTETGAAPDRDCIRIDILQNSGNTITVQPAGATISLTSGGAGTCTVPASNITNQLTGWQSGTTKRSIEFLCTTGAIFASGDSVAGAITIAYTVGSSGLVQSATGNVKGTVQ